MAQEQGPARKRARLGMAAAAAADPDAPPVSAAAYRWSERNVFAAINEGRVPADKVFDRPHYYALLDKMPVTHGHCLLITKHPAATLLENMPAEAMADTMADLQVRRRWQQRRQQRRGGGSRHGKHRHHDFSPCCCCLPCFASCAAGTDARSAEGDGLPWRARAPEQRACGGAGGAAAALPCHPCAGARR